MTVHSDDATPGILAFLKHKRILLILDTCEHLIEAVAALAARIFETAPQVHILATSREALRVEGEHVYRLDHWLARRMNPVSPPSRLRRFQPRSCSSNAPRRAARPCGSWDTRSQR